jgi:hypothetical protein
MLLGLAAVVLGLWRVYSPVWFGRRALLPHVAHPPSRPSQLVTRKWLPMT